MICPSIVDKKTAYEKCRQSNYLSFDHSTDLIGTSIVDQKTARKKWESSNRTDIVKEIFLSCKSNIKDIGEALLFWVYRSIMITPEEY